MVLIKKNHDFKLLIKETNIFDFEKNSIQTILENFYDSIRHKKIKNDLNFSIKVMEIIFSIQKKLRLLN